MFEPSFAERLRLAIAGETDPDEQRKRAEEAIQLHAASVEKKALTAKSHEALVKNWQKDDESPPLTFGRKTPDKANQGPKPPRGPKNCHKCHKCYPKQGACEHRKIVCWVHI